jgi:integrase
MRTSAVSSLGAQRPWNKGCLVGPKLALKPRQVWAVRFHLKREGRLRDLALFDLAVDSKLRGCDLVRLRLGDLLAGSVVRSRALVVQQKTGTPVQFEVTQGTRDSILAWIRRCGVGKSDYLFPSRRRDRDFISTRQYARLLKGWLRDVGIEPSPYGTHSLRRTKVALIYRQSGNIRAIQILLGHTKLDSTVRYLGVDIEDALALAEATDI